MAKRIKVKGNPPRGLSKATRQIDAAQEALDRSGVHMSVRSPKASDAGLAKMAGLGGGITKPSSTRKMQVKEGSRKFIGPRQLKSELLEDENARHRTGGIVLFDNDGDPEPAWMEGKQYADQPNKRRTPLERALLRTQRRQIDLGMEPVDGIEYVPENLRKLIKAKIKGRSSQDRMFRVLARALKKRGGQPSTTDMNRDYDKAYKLGQTDYPF